ncbi:MAG TPA: filamentous hemagglutinin N-terminal domain-containing protein [Candidatus Eisenbacteria bacterium]|nr:filamentous hemagglutinin N-terminal domain-containing protein [Candidatus Eisenbacteria bacterium]
MKKASAWAVLGAFSLVVAAPRAYANPSFTRAESGEVRIEENGAVYNIYSSDRAIGLFDAFSNASGETINSVQASASDTALFRVTGGDPSTILGTLNANSRIFLVNPNGILFGPGSSVNAPGLVASALNLTSEDFLAGNYAFLSGAGVGRVVNRGNLNADQYVVLLGKSVSNEGTITVAEGGTAALAAGESARLLLDPQGLVSIDVTAALKEAAVDFNGDRVADQVANSGLLSATGGSVILKASAAGAIFDNVINHSGVIEASTVGVENGTVTLYGGAEGVVRVTGSIDAAGRQSGETGGTVRVLGQNVGLFDRASVDVSGSSGGGTVLIGGDERGLNPEIPNSTAIYLSPDATVRADALDAGDGGKIVLFAEDSAKIYGTISARGGAEAGSGGFVETSGKNGFEITATPDVSAPAGSAGSWLIDPNTVNIINSGGAVNITTTNPFTTTNDSAALDVNLILAALTGGANVQVVTASAGSNSQAGDINLNAAIDFNGKGTNTLTLDADGTITLNQNIFDSATGSADKLNLNLYAGNSIAFNSLVATGGGDLTAIASTGNITIGAVNNAISTVCATCQNGNAHLEAQAGDIIVQDTSSGLTEIIGPNNLFIEARAVGAAGAPLGLKTVSNLEIVDVNGAGNMLIDELGSNTITSVNISVPTATAGDIDINFFDSDVVDINAGHILNNVNLTGRKFSYIANTGNIQVTSLSVNTTADSTFLFANGGDILFSTGSTSVNGYFEVSASGSVNGGAGGAGGDGLADITLNGGMTISADQVGNVSQLEIQENSAGATFEARSTATLSGHNFNIEVLNLGFDGVRVAEDVPNPNISIDLPGADAISITGSPGNSLLSSVLLTSNADPDFDFELFGAGDVRVQSITLDGAKSLSVSAYDGNIVDSSSSIVAGDVTLYASGNVGTLTNKINVDASDVTALAGAGIGLNLTHAGGNIAILEADGVITVSATNGLTVPFAQIINDDDTKDININAATGDLSIGIIKTGGLAGDVTLTSAFGSIFDANAGDLNVKTDQLTFSAINGTVGTSADPIEAKYNGLTATSPFFVTKAEGNTTTVGGLTLTDGRLSGGENVSSLEGSLYGEQDSESTDEESQDEEKEAAPVNAAAESTGAPPVDEAPAPEDTPPVEAETFSPCGI